MRKAICWPPKLGEFDTSDLRFILSFILLELLVNYNGINSLPGLSIICGLSCGLSLAILVMFGIDFKISSLCFFIGLLLLSKGDVLLILVRVCIRSNDKRIGPNACDARVVIASIELYGMITHIFH